MMVGAWLETFEVCVRWRAARLGRAGQGWRCLEGRACPSSVLLGLRRYKGKRQCFCLITAWVHPKTKGNEGKI